MAGQKPMRLPGTLKALRVKNPNGKSERPCINIMSSVLACWASAGYSTAGCAQVEQALRNCMDAPPPTKKRPSEINYHLARFKKNVTSQQGIASKK